MRKGKSNMRTPVAIFPYCAEILSIVKNFEKLQGEYTITRLVSPSGFGVSGMDAAYVCNHPPIGMEVRNGKYLFYFNHD